MIATATLEAAVAAYRRYAAGERDGPTAADILDAVATSERHWQELADIVIDLATDGRRRAAERECPRCGRIHCANQKMCDACRNQQRRAKQRQRMAKEAA